MGAYEVCLPMYRFVAKNSREIGVWLQTSIDVRGGTICITFDQNVMADVSVMPGVGLPHGAKTYVADEVYDPSGVRLQNALLIGWLNGWAEDSLLTGQIEIFSLLIHPQPNIATECGALSFADSLKSGESSPPQHNMITTKEATTMVITGAQLEVCPCKPVSTSDDCNGNGISDDCEIVTGKLQDIDRNGVADECESIRPFLRGDFNQTGDVGVGDIVSLADSIDIGETGKYCMRAGDANADEKVDIEDVVHLVNYLYFHGSPPPDPFPDPGISTGSSLSCISYTAQPALKDARFTLSLSALSDHSGNRGSVLVTLDASAPVKAISFGLKHDQNMSILRFRSISDSVPSDFSVQEILEPDEVYLTLIVALFETSIVQTIPPGIGIPIATFEYEGSAFSVCPVQSKVSFIENNTAPERKIRIVDDAGVEVIPISQDIVVTILPVPFESFSRGDVTNDFTVDISDPIALLSCLFMGGECLFAECQGDANSDAMVDIADPIFLLEFLFMGGKIPEPCIRC